jgi:hypothetical protein
MNFFYSLHVFVNTSQAGVDISVSSAIRLIQLAPQNCAIYLLYPLLIQRSVLMIFTKALELLCQTYYPFCNSTFSPFQLPSPPCKSKCLSAFEACNSFISSNKELLDQEPDVIPSNSSYCDVRDGGIERWPSVFIPYSISCIYLLSCIFFRRETCSSLIITRYWGNNF